MVDKGFHTAQMTVVVCHFRCISVINSPLLSVDVMLETASPGFITTKLTFIIDCSRMLSANEVSKPQNAAVMKFNGAKQRIFDAVGCRVPLAKLTRSSFLRADLLKAMRSHAFTAGKPSIHRRISI